MDKQRVYNVALAGNPNTGKTSTFNAITGLKQRVGNFSGVTVEKKTGKRDFKGRRLLMVDLPGAYGLSGGTLDERVAADYLINHTPDLVVNVLDAGNLDQGLYLTTHLVDMGLPLVVVLNMWDEVEKSGAKIDIDKFSKLVGVPVIATSAHNGKGIDELLDTIIFEIENKKSHLPHPEVFRYNKDIELELEKLSQLVAERGDISINPHWAATELLSGNMKVIKELTEDEEISKIIEKKTSDSRDKIITSQGVEAGIAMESERYDCIDRFVSAISQQSSLHRMKKSIKIDKILTNRYLGYPIFLVVMWLLFTATFSLGDYPMSWIELGVEKLQVLINNYLPSGMVADLLSEGVIGGVGSVIVFLPNILILFLGISLLETTGYMARAAFISDRLMHSLGLHGRSFIPLLTGFGCSVPAIMATRTLQTQRERILTVLLVPFMSCSAKLPVYVLFVGSFWGEKGGNIIFLIYLIGIVLAVLVAKVFRKFMMKGDIEPCIMELPPYRLPSLKSVSFHTWERTKVYLMKMGGVILIGSVLLWFAAHYPQLPEKQIDNQTTQINADSLTLLGVETAVNNNSEILEYSIIGRIGKALEPVFSPLGFNWQMDVSLLSGFVAKEVVVSTLGVLYETGDSSGKERSLQEALQDKSSGISPLAAFAFLIFVLLYTPCFASVAATRRELGIKWMWFTIFFQTGLAYICALLVFQIGGLFF